MPDVPAAINYGKVVGRFVSFYADTGDASDVPDEVALTGSVTLTPRATVLQVTGVTPPRTALAQTLTCPVVDGWLCAPGTSTPGVFVIATDQPAAQPSTVQWQASFSFSGATLPTVIFDVPTDGEVDLTTVVPATPASGTVTVVSHDDAVAAAAAAAAAEDALDELLNLPNQQIVRYATGDSGELVTSLPIAVSSPTKSVIFSIEIPDLAVGDLIYVTADMQATNDEGYNAVFTTQIIAMDTPTATAGTEITEAAGFNITPDTHHGQVCRAGRLDCGQRGTQVREPGRLVGEQFGGRRRCDDYRPGLRTHVNPPSPHGGRRVWRVADHQRPGRQRINGLLFREGGAGSRRDRRRGGRRAGSQ